MLSGAYSVADSHKTINNDKSNVHLAFNVKDKFSVSNQAYHELSMISSLPSSNSVKRPTSTLNSQFDIVCAPNGIVGVQQSLRARIMVHLKSID